MACAIQASGVRNSGSGVHKSAVLVSPLLGGLQASRGAIRGSPSAAALMEHAHNSQALVVTGALPRGR